MIFDDYDMKILNKAIEITKYDYSKLDSIKDKLIGIIDDLIDCYENKEDELNDLRFEMSEHYRPIPYEAYD